MSIAVNQMSRRGLRLVAAAAGCAILLGCSAGALPPADYVAWVEDPAHGLKVSKAVGGYDFTLQYKPAEYVVLLEEKTPRLNRRRLSELLSEIEDFQYFTLTVRGSGGGSFPGGDAGAAYFSFGMQRDLSLRDGDELLPCRLFHFEPTPPGLPFRRFVLAFPISGRERAARSGGETEPRPKTLIFQDRALSKTSIELSIASASLEALPDLRTD